MPFSEIDLSNPDHFADGVPHAFLRRLRAEAPVHFQGEADGPLRPGGCVRTS